MAQQFSDAARSGLTASISVSDTTITLADGSRFPEADAGTSAVSDANLWFKAVLQDETGFEIVYVRTHAVATTPNTLSNVMRGQEGTTARSFAATSVIGVRLTASDMASLWAKVATKADNSVTLTDDAASATLPATAAAPVASRLQVLRNNVKQLFADLSNKLNTDFTGLTTRTIDGTETLALSGGLKATVQAVLNWVLGRANTWTGTQTFTGGVVANSYSTGNVTLKFKLITVTAGASGTTSAAAAHGLALANIVGFTATLVGAGYSMGPRHSNVAYTFTADLSNTHCGVGYNASNATQVYNQPVHFLIWYT